MSSGIDPTTQLNGLGYVTNGFISPQQPFSRTCILTQAEVSWWAPTNVVDLLTAAENTKGGRVTRGWALARDTPASAINLSLYKKVGSVYTLIDSFALSGVAPSSTTAAPKTDFLYSDGAPLEFEGGVGLAMSAGVALAHGIICRIAGGLYADA